MFHLAVVKVRGIGADDARRAALEERFTIRSAADVAAELGQLKGVLMKAGQLLGVIADGLPPEAAAALATLQADVPPMAPSLAEAVVRAELGSSPERLFLDWQPVPVAAASIGQVHRAVLFDGREVAVKVQYPGVGETIGPDLDNAELLYRLFSSFALKGFDARAFVEELRARMTEELDYRREAADQQAFARAFAGHPFVRVPAVVPERSGERVLTTEWVEGWTFAELAVHADPATRQRAAEAVWRFAQRCVLQLGMFNGDPHPGNYRFHADGTVSFLDFGLVKRWDPGEWDLLRPSLDAIVVTRDPVALVATMEHNGFLRAGHGLDPRLVYDYVSSPYAPYLTDSFTFTPSFVPDTLRRLLDRSGPHAGVMAALDLPASFVILDRVVWGVSALLGRLGATGPWRAMLLEYLASGPPAGHWGGVEHRWPPPPGTGWVAPGSMGQTDRRPADGAGSIEGAPWPT